VPSCGGDGPAGIRLGTESAAGVRSRWRVSRVGWGDCCAPPKHLILGTAALQASNAARAAFDDDRGRFEPLTRSTHFRTQGAVGEAGWSAYQAAWEFATGMTRYASAKVLSRAYSTVSGSSAPAPAGTKVTSGL